MATRNQAGFSLIEIIIVLAITSSLTAIALIGQSALRGRAQFDGNVEKLVASVADAHSQATSGDNVTGPGNGSVSCAGPSVNKYVFAGVGWSITDAAAGSTLQMNYYAASRTAPVTACIFSTQIIGLTSGVRVDMAPLPGQTRQMLFVRDDLGGLSVCRNTRALATALPDFAAGSCVAPDTAGSLTITLTDVITPSRTSVVQIDASGLARRIN